MTDLPPLGDIRHAVCHCYRRAVFGEMYLDQTLLYERALLYAPQLYELTDRSPRTKTTKENQRANNKQEPVHVLEGTRAKLRTLRTTTTL